MNRNALVWNLSGLAVLGVGVLTVIIGRMLMPSYETAATVGTLVPWFITWGMIWMTAIIAVIIAVTLFSLGSGRRASHVPARAPD
jgi:hypothetical protein